MKSNPLISSAILTIFTVTIVMTLFRINPFASQVHVVSGATPEVVPPKITAKDYLDAMERAKDLNPFIVEVSKETVYNRKLRLAKRGITYATIPEKFSFLNSPIIKKVEDRYQPVRFMHKKHAAVINDCTTCHHHKGADPKARDLEKCSTCHRKAFDPRVPDRVGLKAAYHNMCMNCHKEMRKGPVGCLGCHTKNVPSHNNMVKLPLNPTPEEVTKKCLECHEKQGKDVLKSAHWLWKGPSSYTEGRERGITSGKATNTINNFCIHIASNYPRCTSCHIGYGWKDKNFDFTDMTKIDCLVCHDTTGTYKKAPPGAGMPAKTVDLRFVAKNVGKPSRQTCGSQCHFRGGGGDAIKHADMSSKLLQPSRNCDVHMGGYNFQCHTCHETKNHKISGRSFSVPVAEGIKKCEDCHSKKPHYGGTILDHHLNEHTQHIACNTCHTPLFSKCSSTKTYWDWSKAGNKTRKPKLDKWGNPDYSWKKGEFRWDQSVRPEYEWFSGKVERYLLGDKIEEGTKVVTITRPVGDILDAGSKIYPFKIMRGKQPYDVENHYLLVPHLFGKKGYWTTLNWEQSFKLGMKDAGLKYSGNYGWIATEMYWGVEHEVTPKELALSCVQCHNSLRTNNSCSRCHTDNRCVKFNTSAWKNMDKKQKIFKKEALKSLVVTDYINFRKLGYRGDPIIFGGRFSKIKGKNKACK